MPQQVRMWEITPQNSLVEIASPGIDRENRLESWLESDISMLDPDLLVIGRQVRTDFGGVIDLLCMDSAGGLVVVELKRDQPPRDVTAQALDYASWAKDLPFARIREIADGYSKLGGSLEDAFASRFGQQLPETINLTHRSLIVASYMDAATERIVRYLSDLGVPINVATVQHFINSSGQEVLAQVFLVDPEVAQAKAQATSKQTYTPVSQIEAMAQENGVSSLCDQLHKGLPGIPTAPSYGVSGVMQCATWAKGFRFGMRFDDKGWSTVLVIDLVESNTGVGLAFQLSDVRSLLNLFGLSAEKLSTILPQVETNENGTERDLATPAEIADQKEYRGYFRTVEEVGKFLNGLRAAGQ